MGKHVCDGKWSPIHHTLAWRVGDYLSKHVIDLRFRSSVFQAYFYRPLFNKRKLDGGS